MIVTNKNNSKSCDFNGLKSFMLIGESNCSVSNISVQYSEIDVDKEQPVHHHVPEQCYYIIDGEGMMIIGEENCKVKKGDAIYIPSDAIHGIKNIGNILLKYLTTNSPAFGIDYENKLWPNA